MIRRFTAKLKAFFASFGEPKLDRPLTQTETAQLLQLSTGLIADGDLMSKESRDTLIRYGLATRLNGFQTWTERGSQALEEMRMIEKVVTSSVNNGVRFPPFSVVNGERVYNRPGMERVAGDRETDLWEILQQGDLIREGDEVYNYVYGRWEQILPAWIGKEKIDAYMPIRRFQTRVNTAWAHASHVVADEEGPIVITR